MPTLSYPLNPRVACTCAEYLLLMPLEQRNVADDLHEGGWRPGASAVIRMAAELAQALAHLHAMGDCLPPALCCKVLVPLGSWLLNGAHFQSQGYEQCGACLASGQLEGHSLA